MAALFLALAYQGPWFLLVPALLAIIWMINLYNFMDGSDGLAGGMSIAGFGTYAVAAYGGGLMELSVLAAALAGAAAGFLIWNFHKARIFMGDSGSVPLGFLAAALGLLGWQEGVWPMWFPVLVFSPFIADASVTLVKRYLRGERLSQAHRSHYYQRVLRMGLGHRGTALAAYVLMLATSGARSRRARGQMRLSSCCSRLGLPFTAPACGSSTRGGRTSSAANKSRRPSTSAFE